MIKDVVRSELAESAAKAGYDVPAIFTIDMPPKPELGDYATNIALMISQRFPELQGREVAETIVEQLQQSDRIAKAEAAGPGFINITLNQQIYLQELEAILKDGGNYGRLGFGQNRKVNVEYVSANPTGPLHIGNARGGPIGEAIANLYDFLGYEVTREFYVNDIGGQINRLAESLFYWYEVKSDPKIVFPEGGYPGEYIKEISEEIQTLKTSELAQLKDTAELIELFKKEGLAILIRKLKEDCSLLGIEFDRWSYQSDIEYGGRSDLVVERLAERGMTEKREGALWFKNPEDPDFKDQESVLRKSDEKGTLTYFADDIAYHQDKFDRGSELAIDVWGANHHGHIQRLKAAVAAIGYPADKLSIILYQYIRLKQGSESVKMGKRFGNFVTLRQVIEAGVAPDVFKYFILAQNLNTPFDFDLQLALDTSEKNPVYYIKYAHARIASILRKAGETGFEYANQPADLSLLIHPKEQQLIKGLVAFPEIISKIHEDFQMQALPHYAYRIASLFHDFYSNCQVLTEDEGLSAARLSLVKAAQAIIASSLHLLDIEAPEKM